MMNEIAECTRSEKAFVEIEDRLRRMADSVSEVIWIMDLEPVERVVYTSPSFERVWGLRVEDLYQNPRLWTETIHPGDRERVASTFSAWIAGADVSYQDVEFRIVQPNGAIRWIHERGVLTVNEQGRPIRVSGFSRDITDRKCADEELRRNAFYLAEGQRLSHSGSWSFMPSGICDYWSQELYQILGFDPANGIPTIADYLTRVHPEDHDIVKQTIDQMVTNGIGCDVKKRIIRPDGEVRVIRCVGTPVREQGTVTRFVGTLMDITDQERIIQELRRKEAYLAEIARQTSVRVDVSAAFSKPSHMRDVLHRCVESLVRHLDAAFARIWTLNDSGNVLELQASAGMYTRLDGSYSRIPIGDLKVGRIALEKRPHLTNDVVNDHRIKDKIWAQSGGFVSFAGYPLLVEEHVVGVMALFARHPLSETTLDTLASVADIIAQGIERKRIEDKLRADERELRRITDAIPQLICVLGSDGTILYANQMFLEYSGMSLEHVMTDDFRAKLFHPEDLLRVQDNRRHGLERGTPFELELRARRKDGQYRWFLIRYNPLRDEQEHVIRWYCTGTDIEDRKTTEEEIKRENIALREEIDKTSMFEEIIGTSPILQSVLSRVSKVAPTDCTVLVTGETGTGKELVARAIHRRSPRSSRAFVNVNCAAIPHELIASELFGHEKGAFTGAIQRRIGRFEVADGGTIFLDEIGELLPETQSALLRVLQERVIERVGGNHAIPVNVRVVAATNRDLEAAIAAGTFHSDLFYRLNVFPIEIPPLRERGEDIILLVKYFIERYARKVGKNIRRVNKKTLDLLQSYPWPGNIRELQNVIERSVIVCDTENFSVDGSWLSRQPLAPKPKSQRGLSQRLAAQEKAMIEAALSETRGRVYGPSGAAARLGMPRSTLESKIRSLEINKNRFRTSAPL